MTNAKVKTCTVPGCENTLSPTAKTGVCRAHNHAKGYCKCFQCGESAVPVAKPKLPRIVSPVLSGDLHRYSVGIEPRIYRQIRDRAEAIKVSPDRIMAKLLADSVEAGALDKKFPIGEN